MVPPSPATLMRIPGVPPPPVAAPVIGARAVSVVERTVPARCSPLLVLTIIAIIPIIALLLLKLRLLEILLLELLLHHRLLLHLHLLLHEPVKHLILMLVSAHKLRIHHARHEVRCKRGNFGCHKRKATHEKTSSLTAILLVLLLERNRLVALMKVFGHRYAPVVLRKSDLELLPGSSASVAVRPVVRPSAAASHS